MNTTIFSYIFYLYILTFLLTIFFLTAKPNQHNKNCDILVEIKQMLSCNRRSCDVLLRLTVTAKNIEIPLNFQVWKLCGKAQFQHSLGKSSETVRKLHLSTKSPHQEIR